ncbi:Ger(x)C family spore germination protein [Anaerobacillus sp. CMMVII]|uniref:Ger(x)C family spore germination protein n=1 Tax=Anaerobacillus sp. CMMVII TaxID=2755588 RepID=UPI0021B722F9|nr:Ger(x)C family spore germination protein [Anaerobacillus sp. CMMVII]MCT8139422.1 Ger(x)C family spore germination protein [Anaerobacillus sp. CMMVII]
MEKINLVRVLMLLLLLSGCLGKEEINDLALVMAVGIDKGENGDIWITTQVARPADVRGTTGSAGGEPIWTATGEGKTIFEAIRNLAKFSSRRIYWGHNMIIVVSEEVAREGIVDIIDFFTRNNELRMRTWIVVTEKKANEIVAAKTGIEVVPGNAIDRLFRFSPIVAEAPRSNVMALSAGYVGEHVHPYLALVHLISRGVDEANPQEFGSIPQVELSGTAIFRKDKMVGKLNSRESRGFLWFTETVDDAIIPLTCPDEEGWVSVELRDNSFKLTPIYKEGKVSFEATIKSVAHLVELGCPTPLEHSEVTEKLAVQAEKYLKEDIEMMLDKVQKEYKVDALRLGRMFQAKYPQHWDKIKEDWEVMFPDVVVSVSVSVDINNPQLLENPTRPSKD